MCQFLCLEEVYSSDDDDSEELLDESSNDSSDDDSNDTGLKVVKPSRKRAQGTLDYRAITKYTRLFCYNISGSLHTIFEIMGK